jgi:hypothetical protein
MMRAPLPPDPRQGRLFVEVVETVASGPDPFDDNWSHVSAGGRLVRPPGNGWRVIGFDRWTRWMRRRPIVVPQASMVSGRWRRR